MKNRGMRVAVRAHDQTSGAKGRADKSFARSVPTVLAGTLTAAFGVAGGPAWLGKAHAQTPATSEPAAVAVDAGNDSPGFSPDDTGSSIVTSGYVDVGFAKAGGDGTSWPALDTRFPADYGVDPFQTAINTRGDVASIGDGSRGTNGFLPRTLNIGGRPSVFINTVDFDLRSTSAGGRFITFTRVQLLPRFSPTAGNETRVLVDQALGRLSPFDAHEFLIAIGKFDSVVGIEYLDTQANLRTGVTPSLMSRYTTGTSLGAKVFYRRQLPGLWSALSINTTATNQGSMIEALQTPEVSLTGQPVVAGRLGYELNLPGVQVKLGASALEGPRNDQRDSGVKQRILAGDARITMYGLSLSGEYVRVDEDAGRAAEKLTGQGEQVLASEFAARGFWIQAAWQWPWANDLVRRTNLYGRFERRRAWFEGFPHLLVQRLTAGARVDLGDAVAIKGEVLINRELEGAPEVANNVFTSSLVLSW